MEESEKEIDVIKNKNLNLGEKMTIPQIQNPSVKQEQIHDILFNKEIGWQEIIYDLINTEQLDPWNIDIVILTNKYLEKIAEIEEADFFVSSKVLLAASLLLRIKSEILLNKYIRSIDDILFGSKELKKHSLERIELEEEIPELTLRSPIPRFKRVTLQELLESLSKAIKTENRRIEKEIINKSAFREAGISLPKRRMNITDKIKEIYEKLANYFDKNENHRISFTDFVGVEKEERIISFGPLLHLENQKKIWLNQEAHFSEIYIWLKDVYFKNNPDPFADLREELEEEIQELEKTDKSTRSRIEKINEEFENPLAEMFDED
jgi:segregation and condensation protein A